MIRLFFLVVAYVVLVAAPAMAEGTAPDGGITREDAKRIAIAVAPPSRSVMAYPANMDGHPVFEVVFKTYDGNDYVVLVDQPTGEIIQPQKPGKKKRRKN